MVSCDALERSDNPYKESIVEPCVSISYNQFLRILYYVEENPEQRMRQCKKSIHELKTEFEYLCVLEREKKNNSFGITVIILKAYKKCKSPIQKRF